MSDSVPTTSTPWSQPHFEKKGCRFRRLQVLSFSFSFRCRERFDPPEVDGSQFTFQPWYLFQASGLCGKFTNGSSIMLNLKCPKIKFISALLPHPRQTHTNPNQQTWFSFHTTFFLLRITPLFKMPRLQLRISCLSLLFDFHHIQSASKAT